MSEIYKSEKFKQSCSEGAKNMDRSPESSFIKNMSKALTGRKLSPEHKAKIIESNKRRRDLLSQR